MEMYVYNNDDTEKKTGREILAHSPGASDMVVGLRTDGHLYFVSPTVASVLGYSDRDFSRLYNHTLNHADDRRFTAM